MDPLGCGYCLMLIVTIENCKSLRERKSMRKNNIYTQECNKSFTTMWKINTKYHDCSLWRDS